MPLLRVRYPAPSPWRLELTWKFGRRSRDHSKTSHLHHPHTREGNSKQSFLQQFLDHSHSRVSHSPCINRLSPGSSQTITMHPRRAFVAAIAAAIGHVLAQDDHGHLFLATSMITETVWTICGVIETTTVSVPTLHHLFLHSAYIGTSRFTSRPVASQQASPCPMEQSCRV